MVVCPRNHFRRTYEQSLISCRFAATRLVAVVTAQVDHRGDLADQFDLEAPRPCVVGCSTTRSTKVRTSSSASASPGPMSAACSRSTFCRYTAARLGCRRGADGGAASRTRSSSALRASSSSNRCCRPGARRPSAMASIRPESLRRTPSSSRRLPASCAEDLGQQPVPLGGELGDECRDVFRLHQPGSRPSRISFSRTLRRMPWALCTVPCRRAEEQAR